MHTLVQHSGYGYGYNPQFEQAVEEREIPAGKKSLDRIKKVGGIIVKNYGEANNLSELVNYPPEVKGLVPEARGSFATIKVDGLKVYIPSMNDNLGKYHVENPNS